MLLFFGLLGALIGSFANVVIWRLPRGESVAYPPSRCPKCGRRLGPLDLVPVLSWLLLRGRCRSCGAPISPRYPVVELITALGFVALVWRFPLEAYGLTVLPLLVLFSMLVMMSGIDVDHKILPDSLTLPAVVVGVLGSLLYHPESGLPTFEEALFGSALGAGVIVLINRLGGLALRRFMDTKERLWPIGMDQVNLAALGGALYGWGLGLALAGVSVLVNLVLRKPLRLSEGAVYGLWLLALLAASFDLTTDLVSALSGSLAAAGALAVLGATYWWLNDLRSKEAAATTLNEEDDEPIAMGFGDVKLAAVLGAMLGWQNLLLALLLAFFLGAVGGLVARALGGERQVPFGPYLAAGGILALFFGAPVIAWYLSALGV